MSSLSPSSVIAAFAAEIVAAAAEDAVLENAAVLDSKSQLIETKKGIVVSNAEYELAPKQENVISLFDALVIVGFFYEIDGTEPDDRAAARDKCFELAEAFAQAVYDDMSLGNRVCDCLLLRAVDGWDNSTGDTFAIINLPIILNPTGGPIDYILGDAK